MQKMINKKLKLTKEEREAIYYNAKFHERTWFRLVVDLMLTCIIPYLLKFEAKNIVDVTIFLIISSLCVLYVWRGKSRTKIGYIIQRTYGILMIIATIYIFAALIIHVLASLYYLNNY